VHHRHAVADLSGHAQVVRDEQHGEVEFLAHVVEQFQDLRLHGDIQGGHGLVGDQQFGLHCQRARDADALPLPARELVGVTVDGPGIESDECHQVLRAVPGLGLRQAEVHRPLGDRVADAAARIKRPIGILEDDLHALAMPAERAGRQVRDIRVVQIDVAAGRLDQTHDAAGYRRFSGPRLADDPQRLAALHVDVHLMRGAHDP